MSEKQEKDWIESLSERRFLRYTISYIVLAWGIIQASDWAVKRYDWSQGITEGFLIFFVAFLPAVLLFIYHHGEPGVQTWKPIEKWAIPLNLILALGIGGFMGVSHTSASEPVTEMVKYIDEDGEERQRLLYNRSLRHRLLVYPSNTEQKADEKSQLTAYAISEMVMTDLELDNRLMIPSQWSVVGDMKSKGIMDFNALSLAQKRKFAADQYIDYFITSDLKRTGEEYQIAFQVFKTSDAQSVFEKSYVNTDLGTIIDGFSADFNDFLFEDVEVAANAPARVDLPVRDIMTDDEAALHAYIKSKLANHLDNDKAAQLEQLNIALESDPSFFWALRSKANLLFSMGQGAEATALFESGMNLIDQQSERTQLSFKCQYYFYQNDVKKGIRLGEMWRKLYPQNEEAYKILGQIYRVTGEFKKYEQVYLDGYEEGHKGDFLLNLGSLYTQSEEYDKALKYFEEFQTLYPDKTGEISQLGGLYLGQGLFDKAIQYFEDQTIKDEYNYANYITLADAYLKKGDFNSARANYATALKRAKIAQDSVNVFTKLADLAYLEGKGAEYFEIDQRRLALSETFSAKLMVDLSYISLQTINRYTEIGKSEFLNNKLEEISAFDMGGFNWPCVINYNKALGAEDTLLLVQSKNECPEDIFKATSGASGIINEAYEKTILGAYEEALSKIEEFIEASGVPRSLMNPMIGGVYVEQGNYREATKLLERFVKRDRSQAQMYKLLVEAYIGAGDRQSAKSNYDKAITIWQNADPDFEPLVELKELMAD